MRIGMKGGLRQGHTPLTKVLAMFANASQSFMMVPFIALLLRVFRCASAAATTDDSAAATLETGGEGAGLECITATTITLAAQVVVGIIVLLFSLLMVACAFVQGERKSFYVRDYWARVSGNVAAFEVCIKVR
jgi:hypothetical protein